MGKTYRRDSRNENYRRIKSERFKKKHFHHNNNHFIVNDNAAAAINAIDDFKADIWHRLDDI